MTATATEQPPVETTLEIVEDLDEIVESVRCACRAGDDAPY